MILSPRAFSKRFVAGAVAALLATPAWAQDPPAIPRLLPPAGIAVPDDKRAELVARLDKLRPRLDALAKKLGDQPKAAWLADVEVLYKAPETALRFNEFYNPKEFDEALKQVGLAEQRCTELEAGEATWRRATGLVLRGYKSQLDGSYQPYGLVIPKALDLTKTQPLYVFLHGRGEKMTDLAFVAQRLKNAGDVLPENAIVLHPFGRYCNGWKFGGEVDALESIAAVSREYKIDPDRIVLVGFSMGGAGAWYVGSHYTDHFCAVAPGAGFAETALFQKLTPEKYPIGFEQVLWRLTDVPDYVRNLFNVPTIAYSGELDKQIQAAQVMEAAFQKEGRKLPHLIGPQTEHKYHPETLAELMKQLDAVVKTGRPKYPTEVHLQTQTLRYSKMFWVQALALQQHWQDARIDATIDPTKGVVIETKNVDEFALDIKDKGTIVAKATQVVIDGQPVKLVEHSKLDHLVFARNPDRWIHAVEHHPALVVGGKADSPPPRKFPGLQGPIDDAFLEPFVLVVPTGEAASPEVQKWVNTEVEHLIDRWRRFWRGDVRVVRDVDVKPEDYQNANLVCFGDLQSNKVLAEAGKHLPIAWTADSFRCGAESYDAKKHVPLLIYPNPLNQKKYLVVNSGPTFREAHDKSNALQTAKLPDWAVVDATTAPDDVRPGKVLAAGFFDEYWKFTPHQPQPTKR